MLDRLLGNAAEINVEQVRKELADLLVDGEELQRAFVLVRDFFVFANRRLIFIDKQGLSGKKVEYRSIPYRSITHFSVETSGTFDRDAELKIYIGSNPVPMEVEFKRGTNLLIGVQKTLASHLL